MSSSHEKKQRSLRVQSKAPAASSTASSSHGSNNPSIIATPPRVALQQARQQQQQHAESDSKSGTATGTHSSPTKHRPASQDGNAAPSGSHEHTSREESNNSSNSSNNVTTNNPTAQPPPPHYTASSSSSRPHRSPKDTARIAELEQDLASITAEFSVEVSALTQKLTTETESALFWQQKHTLLHQTFLKTDTDLRLLRSQQALMVSQQEERERDIKTRISSLMMDRDAVREAYNEAVSEVRKREEEVRVLQGQVRGLKSWVSREGRGGSGEQVSDEVIGEGMQRLGNGLQNWVITNFRRVKIDTDKVDDETKDLLMQLVPTYESLASTSKIHLIQSLVSRIIVEHIFLAFFAGLSEEQAEALERVEKSLSNLGTTESMNQWRSTTLAIIHKDAPVKLAPETTRLTEDLVKQINGLMTAISDIQPAESRDQSLRALIASSIEVSRLLRVQKAVFSILMPCIEGHQKTVFDPDCMEDIGGEDDLNEREIRCVTFPGIVKSGDENGERMHLRNVVAKIRVLCAPD